MEPSNGNNIAQMQLVMDANSITLHAFLMPGVLTTQKFEGIDCYPKFIDFMKHSSAEKNGFSVIAEIIVR
ncbi:MAG TPA: hypothetical protein VF172_12710 [Nitrososphaera sp.]|jgi:hypothetical protein